MQRRRLTVWVALAVLAMVAVAGSTTALLAADQASNERLPNYNGANEPDNPNCPDPSEYGSSADYSKHGHDCAVPNDPAPNRGTLGSGYTDVTWNSHWFFYGPGQHEPGFQGASYAFRSWPVKEDFNMEFFEYVAIYAPWGRFSGDSAGTCTVADTQAAGIDRGNDGNNGKYHTTQGGGDDSLVSAIQQSGVRENYGYFQFAGPDSFGDRNIPLNHSDAFVAALGDCWANPKEPGWYRMTVWFNGTDYDGNEIGWKGWNHWQYFCSDCENRQDAIDKFGPPGTNPDSPWKDTTVSKQSTRSPTPSPTPTATPSPTPDSGADTATPTPDSGSDQTATPSPTATATATPSPTPTAAATPSPTPTAAATPSPTPADRGGASTPSATPTSAAGGGGGSNPTQAGPAEGSPTAQSGPGFGVIAALLGLVTLALWVARRP